MAQNQSKFHILIQKFGPPWDLCIMTLFETQSQPQVQTEAETKKKEGNLLTAIDK